MFQNQEDGRRLMQGNPWGIPAPALPPGANQAFNALNALASAHAQRQGTQPQGMPSVSVPDFSGGLSETLNGIFASRRTPAVNANPYDPQEQEIGTLIQQIMKANQDAYATPVPKARGITALEGIGGILAALLDPQAGAGYVGGLNQGFERENARRQTGYEATVKGKLAGAEGLKDLANYKGQQLGRRIDRDQFSAKQRADESQFTRGLASKEELLGLRNENSLALQGLRDDAMKAKEGEKARAARRRDLTRTLQDPKTTPEAREIARRRLEGEFSEDFTPEEIVALSKPTYVQKGSEAGARNKDANTNLANEKATDLKTFRADRKRLIQQNVRTSEAKAANLAAVTSFLGDKMAVEFARADAYVTGVIGSLANQQYGQEVEMRGQDLSALKEALQTNSSQANTLRGNLSTLRASLAKDPKNEELRNQARMVYGKILELGERDKTIRETLQGASANRPTPPNIQAPRVPRSGLPQINRGGKLGRGEVQDESTLPPLGVPPVQIEGLSKVKEAPTKPATTSKPKGPVAPIIGDKASQNILGKALRMQEAARLRKAAAEAIKQNAPRDQVMARLKADLAKLGVK
jgi:hypothetical protein